MNKPTNHSAAQKFVQANQAAIADDQARHTIPDAWELIRARVALTDGRLPAGWHLIQVTDDGLAAASSDGLRVIVSAAREDDGRRWLHVSYSRATALPSYADTMRVRRLFIGDDHYCLTVWPPTHYYVNLHAHCLHLWSCLDGHPLPEFSHVIAGVRLI